MAIQTTSDIYDCEDCAHADRYGRSCKVNDFTPILLLMHGRTRCPFHEFKSRFLKDS